MIELIEAIHTCANILHEIHIAVKDVPVHKLFQEWYEHMFNDYDNFVEWARIKSMSVAHSIRVINRNDMTVEEAYREAAGAINGTITIAAANIPEDKDAISCGIRSDIESFCSYWAKVSLYMMRS